MVRRVFGLFAMAKAEVVARRLTNKKQLVGHRMTKSPPDSDYSGGLGVFWIVFVCGCLLVDGGGVGLSLSVW